MLKLAMAKSPLAKQCTETRQDALAEDLPGSHLANKPQNISVNIFVIMKGGYIFAFQELI